MGANYRIVRIPEKTTFLQKHKKWFELLSIPILFGTFIVNEVLRNQSKDIADSIELGRVDFSLRQQIQTIYKGVDAIEFDIPTIYRTLNTRLPPPSPPKDPFWTGRRVEGPEYLATAFRPDSDDEVQVQFDNAAELLLHLPYDRLLDDKRWALYLLRRDQKAYWYHMALLEVALRTGPNESTKREGQQSDYYDEAMKQDQERVKRTFDLHTTGDRPVIDQAFQSFNSEVDARATQLLDVAQGRYELWSRLSFLLYPLGLAVGVLGKLSGGESELPE